ncbi:MAG: hypothetical protein AB1431_07340 [Pseudomonadota bacterium]
MPRIQTYGSPQVGPAQATNARFRPADNNGGVGGAVAQGLQQIGVAGQQFAANEIELQKIRSEARIRETFNESADFIRELTETGPDAYYRKQGRDALASSDGVKERLSQKFNEMRARHSSPLEQQMFEASISRLFTDTEVGIARHDSAETITYGKQEAKGTQLSAVNSAILARDPETRESFIAAARSAVAKQVELDGGPPELTKALQDATEDDVHAGIISRHLTEDDYTGAVAYLTENESRFGAEARAKALNAIRIKKAQIETAANRAQSEQAQADKDFEDTVAGATNQGIIVSQTEFDRAISTARARGDNSKALQLEAAAYANRATAMMQNASVPQVSARLAEIEAAKDWRTKPELVLEHNSLDKLRTTLRNKPAAFAPLDVANPKSVEARRRAAYSDAKTRGLNYPQLFDGSDVANLQKDYQSGPAGRMRAVAAAAAFGGRDAMIAARQIAPNDGVFIHATQLAGEARALALNGREYLATNPELNAKKADGAQWNALATPVLRGMPPDSKENVKQTTLSIAASLMAQAGVAKPTSSQFQEYYGAALHLALGGSKGASGKTGGIGEWRGAPILLPTGMTQSEFDARLSRIDVQIDAHYGGRDGPLISMKALRRDFTPEAIGGGLYRFRGEDGELALKANGTPTVVDINRVPAPKQTAQARPAATPAIKPGNSIDDQRNARGWLQDWLFGGGE